MSKSFLGDLFVVWLLLSLSLSVGIFANQFRNHPLPLVYQSKDQRLRADVSKLLPAQPFNSLSRPLSANLDLEQFHEYVEANRGLILDARPELFHRLGHVPGAISLPRESFSATYEKIKGKLEHNKGQPIVVYCSELTCEDSVMVQSALVQLGFTHVSVFRGGWDEWTQAGFPTERN